MNDHSMRLRPDSTELYTSAPTGSTASSTSAADGAAGRPPRKMRKGPRATACTECRKQKIKCINDTEPTASPTPLTPAKRCSRCVRLDLTCVVWWSGPRAPRRTAERLAPREPRAGPSGTSHSPVEHPRQATFRGHDAHDAMAPSASTSSGLLTTRLSDYCREDSEEDELEETAKEIYPAGDMHFFRPIAMPEPTGSQSATPGDHTANGVAPTHTSDDSVLHANQSILDGPFALLSYFCSQQSAFGADLRRSRPDPQELDILALIDQSTSERLEQHFLPYYAFLPHIIPIWSIRSTVEKDRTPSAELLLTVQYLLSLRLTFSSRDLIVAKVQRAHHESVILQEKLKTIIKDGAEDVMLSLTTENDDYAIQALELLWCYFPLALERLPKKRRGTSILGQEFLSSAIAASRLMQHDKLSAGVCSLRYWQTLAVDTRSKSASEKARLEPITEADLESMSDTTLSTHSLASRRFHPHGTSTALEENIRKAGRIALIARLRMALKAEETISRALNYQAEEDEALQDPNRMASLGETLNALLSSLSEIYDTGVTQLAEHSQHCGDETAVYRQAMRLLSGALELELQQSKTRGTLFVASVGLGIHVDHTRIRSSHSLLTKMKSFTEPMRQLFDQIGPLREECQYAELSMAMAILRSNLCEIYPGAFLSSRLIANVKNTVEEHAARIAGWGSKSYKLDVSLLLMRRIGEGLSGFDFLSDASRHEAIKFAVREGDIRCSAATTILAFTSAMERWRQILVDRSMGVKSTMKLSFDANKQSALSGSITGSMDSMESSPDGQQDPLLRALLCDEPDWAAILGAL